MQNDRVVSINNTTQMDLQGQAASESAGHRHISGTGGQSQFVRGAYASNGGKSFICMSSTYERRGVRASRIVVDLTPGNVLFWIVPRPWFAAPRSCGSRRAGQGLLFRQTRLLHSQECVLYNEHKTPLLRERPEVLR